MYLVWTMILITWEARTVSKHCELLDWYGCVWWNWNDMSNVWVIKLYVIILVEMKLECTRG